MKLEAQDGAERLVKGPVRSVLPASLPPRGLSRVAAAQYIGISPSKFDELVAVDRMPRPKRIDGRVVWDRHQLDTSFDALPHDGAGDDKWDVAL